MAKIYESVSQLIGRTPILRVKNIEAEYALKAKLLVKLESFNPAGSAKDRVAQYIIEDAEKSGRLQPGGIIIEPTSGNTGIGLAAIAAYKGYKAIIVMPDTMSIERRKLLSAYGAEIVLTDGKKGMQGAIEKAETNKAEFYELSVQAQNFQTALNNNQSKFVKAYNDVEYVLVQPKGNKTAYEELCVSIVEENYNLVMGYNSVLADMLDIISN